MTTVAEVQIIQNEVQLHWASLAQVTHITLCHAAWLTNDIRYIYHNG